MPGCLDVFLRPGAFAWAPAVIPDVLECLEKATQVINIPPPPRPRSTSRPSSRSFPRNARSRSRCPITNRRTSGIKPPGQPTTGTNSGPIPAGLIWATAASWCPASTEFGKAMPFRRNFRSLADFPWLGKCKPYFCVWKERPMTSITLPFYRRIHPAHRDRAARSSSPAPPSPQPLFSRSPNPSLAPHARQP